MEEEIAAWLRVQAEADVNRAELAGGGEWCTGCECECGESSSCERVEGADITIYAEGGHDADQALHIAAHDPRTEGARAESVLAVLGEYEAARALPEPEEYAYAFSVPFGPSSLGAVAVTANGTQRGTLKRTVRLLAYGYRHREGYKEEAWKP